MTTDTTFHLTTEEELLFEKHFDIIYRSTGIMSFGKVDTSACEQFEEENMSLDERDTSYAFCEDEYAVAYKDKELPIWDYCSGKSLLQQIRKALHLISNNKEETK